jgi:hypothetical protein
MCYKIPLIKISDTVNLYTYRVKSLDFWLSFVQSLPTDWGGGDFSNNNLILSQDP